MPLGGKIKIPFLKNWQDFTHLMSEIIRMATLFLHLFCEKMKII